MRVSLQHWVFCFLIVLSPVALAADKKPDTDIRDIVLLVHSYHKGYDWTDAITEGVKKGLEDSDLRLEIHYMDTKRNSAEAAKRKAGTLALQKVRELKPRAVITADDNAQGFFGKLLAGKEGAPQIVFCGVNSDPAKYGYPAGNVTGVLERPHFVETVKLLQRIVPQVKKVAILTDDSLTSDGAVEYMRQVEFPVKIISVNRPGTFEQWQETVRQAEKSADAILLYMYHTVRKKDEDERVDPRQVLDWTLKHCAKPVVCGNDFSVKDGCLCGVAHSGEEHGFKAAQMARRIIKEKKAAGDLKLVTAVRGAVMLNLKTAERLGVEIPYRIIRNAQEVIR